VLTIGLLKDDPWPHYSKGIALQLRWDTRVLSRDPNKPRVMPGRIFIQQDNCATRSPSQAPSPPKDLARERESLCKSLRSEYRRLPNPFGSSGTDRKKPSFEYFLGEIPNQYDKLQEWHSDVSSKMQKWLAEDNALKQAHLKEIKRERERRDSEASRASASKQCFDQARQRVSSSAAKPIKLFSSSSSSSSPRDRSPPPPREENEEERRPLPAVTIETVQPRVHHRPRSWFTKPKRNVGKRKRVLLSLLRFPRRSLERVRLAKVLRAVANNESSLYQ